MTQSSLFNNPKENIKVGYIDPKLGYVSNVSVCEANEYAELNPGTTFIFTDGNDNIRYLRIKEVNQLTLKDLIRTKECDPDFVKCGPPKIQLFGGGGIGAAANPIISPVSGAIIAADLVRGGHGYKIEPFAQAIDPCNRGAGAVFETRVGIVTTEDEVFDKEDDFEVYNICPDTTVNPRMWGPEGEDLGEWNPDKYFNVDKDQDPIQKEIEKYQKYLKSYTNPWWDSRKKSPRLVTGDGKSFNKVYPVTHVGLGITTNFVELKSDNPPPPPPPSPTQEVEFNLYRDNGMPGNADSGISNIQITFTPIRGEGEAFSFVNDTPNKKIVKKKVSVYKNTVYKVTSTLTETAKDKHETVEQGTLESRNSESTSWARGTGTATYKEFNKPSTVMFADALPTANDNDDFIISVPTGFGIFKTGNKTKVSTADGSQSRSYWDIEYVLEAPTAPPVDSATNPNLKAKFVKKDGGIYLDTSGFSGNVEIDLKFLIADPLKGGDGYAALDFKIPGTPIFFSRKNPVTGAIKDRDSIQQKYTVEGGKLYGPVVFSGGAAHSTFEIAGENTIASLDPKSAAQLNRERTNLNQVERDFDVVINSSRGNAKSASPTLIGISTEFRFRTWNDFMNTYAVSPVPDSTLPGSDFPNILFSIEWEENFPYAGEYIFRGCRDNVAQLYVDNLYISDLQNFNEEPKPVPVQMTEGNHVIRVDLLNFPIKEKITVDSAANYTPNPSETAAPSPTTPKTSAPTTISSNSTTASTKTSAESTVTKVFNTIDYITKASRPLWRTNPTASKTSPLIDRYGICPFDTKTAESQKSSYAGTHEIIWENIKFPVDGYYRISLAVDDNVTLWIGNRGSGGTANDGSGRILNEGEVGDEVIIRHEGFFSPGKSRGDLVTTKFFKAGSYRIRADLEQIEVGPIAKGNPMALAINIETSYIESEVIASRSWQQNPMGVALTIQAPEVPVPQEKPPAQIGRCPSNPFWTTRFPGSKQKWYPVRYDGAEIVDIKVNTDEFKTDNQPQDNGSLTEEVELTLYRANGMPESPDGDKSNIFVKLEPIEGEGEVIEITNDLPNKVPTKKKITVYKNTVYKVTSGLTPNAKPKHELVEQGTLELKEGDTSNTPWVKNDANKIKEFNSSSSVLFVDALPTANDNNDFVITVPKGKGLFKPLKKTKIKTSDGKQTRNTWEINYVLEAPVATKNTVKASTGSEVTASGAPGGSVTQAKAKFVKRPDDNQFYLDLTQFSGKVEVELKFDVADRISGSGSAATQFSIPGTTISYDRFNYKDEKVQEKGVVTRRFLVDGGRAYGPIKTSGGTTNYGAGKEAFQTFKFDDNTLTLLDPHSVNYDLLKRVSRQGNSQEDITAVLRRIARERSDGKRDFDITILGVNPASLSAITDAAKSSGTKPNSDRYAGRFTGESPDAVENGSITTTNRRVTRTTGWSKFTNRYAISPVPPLGSRGSDRAGITFSNTWDIDIPFTAFYGFKATADNQGRILLDGEEILKAEHFLTDSPKSIKKRIEKGRHQLTVEVYNKPQFVTTTERQKVFSTQDWQVSKQDPQKKMVGVQFKLATAASFINRLEIVGVFNEVGPTYERGSKIPNQLKKVINADIEVGKVYDVIVRNEDKRSPRMNLRSKGQLLEVEDWTDFNWTDYLCSTSVGRFFDVDGDKCKFIVDPDPPATSSSRVVNGVTYEGPELFGYKHNAWSDFMNKYSVSPVITPLDQQNPTVKYVRVGNDIFLDTTQFEGNVEIVIKYDINDVQNKKGDGLAALKFEIPGTPISFDRNETGVTITNTGGKSIERKYIVTGGSLYGPIIFSGGNGTPTILENSSTVMSLDQKTNTEFQKKGFRIFTGGVNRDFDATIQSVTGQSKVKKQSNNELVGDKILRWKNVNFPVTAQYLIELQADNIAQLKIDGKEIHRTVDFRANVIPFFASVTKGPHDIEVVLTNSPPVGLNAEDQTFDENPTGVALIISVDITNRSVNPLAWQDDNPMGISAIMIAPPCPKPTSGKGVVTDIIPIDPGNGYTPPLPGPSTYPVTLTVSEVIITAPGINYNCGVDEIVIEPSNGAQLDYVCDSFGRISNITVVNPGLGFTSLPKIDIVSSTGINFSAVPVLKPVRDPIGVDEEKLIQVTDLVGLKQTGYIKGRAYYGAVFFENGIKYAGYYRTAGDLVQVYDTLQESIDATVTTPPSAIERSGTDPGSNNPRLNIPGTPENLRDLNQ